MVVTSIRDVLSKLKTRNFILRSRQTFSIGARSGDIDGLSIMLPVTLIRCLKIHTILVFLTSSKLIPLLNLNE
jgi:hypothetical protein